MKKISPSHPLVFSFWNYLSIDDYQPGIVRQWKEMGCNLAMSFSYDPKLHSKTAMIAFLDECQQEDIKVIIVDSRTHFRYLAKVGVKTFTLDAQRACQDFASHPAVYGFFIGDEPAFTEIDDFIKSSRIVADFIPDLQVFGNFLPYFSDMEFSIKEGRDLPYLYGLLRRITDEGKISLVGFDVYTQCLQANEDQKQGIKSYFSNLKHYGAFCREKQLPLYASLCAVGHWHYRVPTEDDLRWQVGTALAYGANAIVWFYFHQKPRDLSFRLAPFDHETLEPTPTYGAIKRVQRFILRYYGEIFRQLSFQKVEQFGDVLEQEMAFIPNADIASVTMSKPGLGLLTTFKKDNKNIYMITNGDQRLAFHFKITLTNEKIIEVPLGPGEFFLLEDGVIL